MANISVLGICGSLRRQSYNLGALQAAGELMPQGMALTITRFDAIPLFNQDLEAQAAPPAVLQLAQEIRDADAVLFASPEYNFSISGVLKNAIDWMSRQKPQPFKDKPVALMSATLGPVGGARHQYELRKVLGCLEALVMPRPEVFINLCQPKFDADVHLVDAAARKAVQDQMTAFGAWTARMLGR
ncbi:MAG: NAD(P)H-dependent oxidoreductase [Rhodoferax sp.]|nr:NAD(P)H-dependent oxidoreductase [Rhodoferax sp.]MCB2008529.1 NAD(P)H-dependent oxidoreductase [Rhodoferax sp.]MCB2028348.1 NAD(P)H-dependent oxidoreductase [Rhodoferax sp.]MCB2041430.1 NAD(P)H-dependent oxidoreductase [Rhodoferax sp.]MCP5263362.1 NAD(P)H-dependent oxidoreductase [Rhodoferax sp.]